MKKVFIVVLFSCSISATPQHCSAQDSVLINTLLKRIAGQQVKHDDYFLQGIFPSYISKNESFSDLKKNNNIFYNALISYTLKNIRPRVSIYNQLLIDSILECAKPLYKKFKNQKGRNTYNFWRTDTVEKYPYASHLHSTNKTITLPDDMDDTVLSLLALDESITTAEQVHALMQSFINSDTNRVRSVIKQYKLYPAYSTWFGKKFPVVFDASVLCNILSFVQSYNLTWTKADSASLALIIKTIENNYYIDQPIYASPYYAKTSIILYHIARLMSVKTTPQLEALKVKLITDAVNEFANSDNLLEKIILSSAILKWGYVPPPLMPSLNDIENKIEKNDFCFFVGNIPSYFPDLLRKYATRNKAGIFYHYCPAYNDALVLEYLVLKQQ